MPKVSVIIPVYNVEKYLGECLDSVLGQTLKDIEVLCVDDGSTDGSAAILAEYAGRDGRVKLYSSPHAGAFRAREVGVKAAKGEFTYFMDADDLLELTAFEELCALADRERLDQIVFASSVFCEDDISLATRRWAATLTRYYSVPAALSGKVMGGMELMTSLLKDNHFHVSPPLRIIRTSVLQDNEYGFPDATSRADSYFTPVSLYYSKRACAVSNGYYRRRVREGSVTTAPGAELRHFRNLFHVLEAFCVFPPFKEELKDPNSTASRYVASLAVNLDKWAWKMTGEERLRLIGEALADFPEEGRVLVVNALLLTVKGLRRRVRPTLRAGTKLVLRKLARRILGRKDQGWWI